jgi:hypothetical protein
MLPACVPFIGSAALLIRRRRVSAAPQLLVQAVSLRSGADMSALWSWWKAETKHVGGDEGVVATLLASASASLRQMTSRNGADSKPPVLSRSRDRQLAIVDVR